MNRPYLLREWKTIHNRKCKAQIGTLVNLATFKEGILTILYNPFQKIEAKVIFIIHSKVRIILILKPGKDTVRKVNYKTVSLMSIDAKINNISKLNSQCI